jgi:hypothetical protein
MKNRSAACSLVVAVIAAAGCGGDSATTTVPAASVAVSLAAPTIFVASTTQATAKVLDASGNTLIGRTVAWTSGNTAVATVDASGLITGVAPGTGSITATVEGKTGSASVTITSKIVNFTATMTPAGEIGANLNGNPTGSGTFTATLDTTTNAFAWSFTFTGMTSIVNNGHIHGPFVLGGASNSAGVVLNFDPASAPQGATNVTFTGLKTATSGSGGGNIVLAGTQVIGGGVSADSLRKLLLAGNAYVNIHTTSNGGGEIRGQIAKK